MGWGAGRGAGWKAGKELTCPDQAPGGWPRGLEVRAWCGGGRTLGAERWAWGME